MAVTGHTYIENRLFALSRIVSPTSTLISTLCSVNPVAFQPVLNVCARTPPVKVPVSRPWPKFETKVVTDWAWTGAADISAASPSTATAAR